MSQIRTVVTRSSRPPPLPPWVASFTFIIGFLRQRQLLEALAVRFAFPRQGGYVGLDLLIAGIAYFVAPESGGIKGFCREVGRFGKRIAASVGLKKLPSAAALSRLLAATSRLRDPEEFVSWLLTQASDCSKLLANPLVQARDALGMAWWVFDFDPTVAALRLRALAEGADLPEAIRRCVELCAPGHTGRKRGDTQFSTAMLSLAGAGLWIHASVWDGNAHFAKAIGMAAKAVARTMIWAGLPLAATVLRFDGAGGHYFAIAAVVEHGVHYLTRLGSCNVLSEPGVMEYLATATWQPVRDSASGPRREATELGTWALNKEQFLKETPDDQALRSRLVVSRFPAAKDGKRHGSGVEIGDCHYEVFATDLPKPSWSAPESVTLYYGRCGQENSFAQSSKELQLGKVHSMTIAGQRMMTVIGMWVANLRRVMAVQHQGDLGPAPDQQPRPAEADLAQAPSEPVVQPPVPPEEMEPAVLTPVAADELMTELVVDSQAVQDDAAGPIDIHVIQAETATVTPVVAEPPVHLADEQEVEVAPVRRRIAPEILAQVAGTLTCRAGVLIPLTNIRPVNGTYTYATYRSPAGVCGQCTQFKGCTHGVYPSYRREFGVRIPGWALEFRHEILQHYRQLLMPAAKLAVPAAPIHPAAPVPSPLPTPPPPVAPPAVASPPRLRTKTKTKTKTKDQAPAKPQGPRLILPTEPSPPGPWIPAPASLFMPVLLANWQAHIARHRVEIEVREQVRAPPRPWVRHTDAERQCRRQTWAQRRLYNTSNAKVKITITEYSA